MSDPQNNGAETGEALRLPLWRTLADRMMAEGVSYGQTFATEYFEKGLCEARGTMAFNMGVHQVRRVLQQLCGMHLTTRGQHGKQYVILPAEANADVMAAYARKASEALRRGVIIGTATPLSVLSAEDRRRHESMLEKLATKSALIRRSSQIAKVIQMKSPGLLNNTSQNSHA